jgi:CRP-like cAMP-binding protein
MNNHPLLDFIRQSIPNFRLTPEGLGIIAENFDAVEYAKDDFLYKEGKVSGYFFLAEGLIRAFTFDAEGNEITTYFYPAGRVLFDPASFFQQKISTESFQAVTECKGYLTNLERLNFLFHTIPEFREFARAMVIREFIFYKQHSLAMINKSAEDRYAALISDGSEILQHARLKHIASFLGMTDTSLSRIRREFSRK